MQLKFLKRLIALSCAMLWLSLISACAPLETSTVAIPDACAWVKEIYPNPGYRERWTADEMRQVLAHDLAVEKNCKR